MTTSSEAKMFPSDRYVLETQTRFHGLDPDEAIIEVAARLAAGLDLYPQLPPRPEPIKESSALFG